MPAITRAAGFEQPLSLHNGGGRTGSVSYKWEQENGIFEFDGKPLPKLLAAISNAEWEGMIWGPYTADRPKFYTTWIDFCEQYNPGMKYFLIDAWPTLGQVQMQYKRKGNPESESFFTDDVFDQLNDAANKNFEALVGALRETTEKVYILPTNAAMTEAAKRFNRGELPGVEGLYKVIGGKQFSIWNDQRGHLGPGFDRLEGYVFYATIYGKSPELISTPIKFSNNPGFLTAKLDKMSLLSVGLFGQIKTPTHAHVSYGPEDRQWLNLYLPSGDEPAPVFLYAHHNAATADDVKSDWADATVAAGIAIVSWESIAQVKGPQDGLTCMADADIMFAWIKDNARTYNLDVNNIIIGGQSRGSGVSWRLAHSQNAGIVGI